jgi:hypothetical protein
MTALWGPLGWMTLHSISICYPENPEESDKQTLDKFMNAFAGSISCPDCKNHFGKMFSNYKRLQPDWNASRYNLFLAVCRMHNTVNRRLDKPAPRSVAACLETLKNATSVVTPAQFRQKYIDYLTRNWLGLRDQRTLTLVNIMRSINDNYWVPRENSYNNVVFAENDVYEQVMQGIAYRDPKLKVKFSGGRFITVRLP